MKNKKVLVISLVIFVILIMCITLISIIIHSSKVKNKEKNVKEEYTCNKGYTLKNNVCLKEIDSIKPIIDYSCSEEYELNQDRCIKYEKQTPKVKWTCPTGYNKMENKEKSLCMRTTTESPTRQYYCSYGYTLNGTKCTKEEIIPATANYVCSGNSMYNSSIGLCQLMGVTNSCPSGMWAYSTNGPYKTCVGNPTITYDCPSNSRKVGYNCIVSGTSIDASYSLRCKNGYKLSNDKTTCTYTEYILPTNELYCNEGYNLDNNVCVKKIYKEANKKYSCQEGYSLTTDKCVKYDKQEPIKK